MVCTGNTCRSPLVAAWLAHLVEGSDVRVGSGGLLGWNEREASAHGVSVAAERGVVLDGHRSRRLAAADVGAADLIVAMTRDHAWGVGALDARSAERTFLLPEVVRRARGVGPRRTAAPRSWVASVAAGRDHRRPGRPDDEIPDPAGQALEVYEALAARVEPLVLELAGLIR